MNEIEKQIRKECLTSLDVVKLLQECFANTLRNNGNVTLINCGSYDNVKDLWDDMTYLYNKTMTLSGQPELCLNVNYNTQIGIPVPTQNIPREYANVPVPNLDTFINELPRPARLQQTGTTYQWVNAPIQPFTRDDLNRNQQERNAQINYGIQAEF